MAGARRNERIPTPSSWPVSGLAEVSSVFEGLPTRSSRAHS